MAFFTLDRFQCLSVNYRSSKWSWCVYCFVWRAADECGPVSVPVRGHDLLWLRWWNGASLQPCQPALCLHVAPAAPPPRWCLGHHPGQVRKSSGATHTRPILGSDPLRDQTLSIYSASCLQLHHFTVWSPPLLMFQKKISDIVIPWSLNNLFSLSPTSHLFSTKEDDRYPAAIAVTYDPLGHRLSCVYNDHSLYVWDVRDVSRVGKVHSALFHAACVWDLEVNIQEEINDTCRQILAQ